MRPGANSSLVLSSLVFEYSCDAIVLVDSELTVRAINPAAQALLARRGEEVAGRLDCRTVLGCRPEHTRPHLDVQRAVTPCLCEQVLALHRAVGRSNMRIRPHGRREIVVSASCSPLPVDHLGGAVLILRTLDEFGAMLAAGELRAGDLRMDIARHQVYANGHSVHLTPIDFDLLRYLMANAGRVVTRHELIEHVWRYTDVNDRDLIKSHIGALRQRLREAGTRQAQIENVYGVGYMLTTAEAEAPPLGSAPAPGDAGDWW